ncbi:MAG TPA: hypothetical protein VFX16_28360 [Pseudonocardiaceae bacterium]|nr:hypothetical protein [Pseudonocardiaceae bacterium]
MRVQEAGRHVDGRPGHAGQAGQVPNPHAVGVQHTQHVRADRQRQRRLPLVLQRQREQYPGEQTAQRQVGVVAGLDRFDPAEQAVVQDRQAVGQTHVELACHRLEGFTQLCDPAAL